MRIVNLTPNTPEWLAHRCTTWNASDAPAALSCSPYKSRKDLIAELASGITPEVDGHTQRRFDLGHVFEELARPVASAFIGEDLFVVVGVADKVLPGMTRPLGASLDGITLLEDICWEHKSLNADIYDVILAGGTGNDLPLVYRVQMEQQLLVSGAEKCLFTASSWIRNAEDHSEWLLDEIHHLWYFPDHDLRAQIIEAWKLVEADVAAFDPAQHAPAPKLLAKPQEALPALRIDARGEIAFSNLDDFKAIAVARINAINTTLETDQHFADADADAKWLREVSKGMKEALQRVRAGMASVDEVMTTLDHLDKMAATKALDLEKRVKSEKDARKMALVMETKGSYGAFVAGLNASLGSDYIQASYDFAPHIKGLKTIDSMRDKLSAALAEQIAQARALAEKLRLNLDFASANCELGVLFPDFSTVGMKDPFEFREIALGRIAMHKQAEAVKLEREALAKAEALALQQAQDAIAQAACSTATASPEPQFVHVVLPTDLGLPMEAAAATATEPVADNGPTITLGQLNALLAPVKLDASGLEQLGFTPVATAKSAKLYLQCSVPAICRAVINVMSAVMARKPNTEATSA